MLAILRELLVTHSGQERPQVGLTRSDSMTQKAGVAGEEGTGTEACTDSARHHDRCATHVIPPHPHHSPVRWERHPHFTGEGCGSRESERGGLSQLASGRAVAGPSQHMSLCTGGGLHLGKLRAETMAKRETTGGTGV